MFALESLSYLILFLQVFITFHWVCEYHLSICKLFIYSNVFQEGKLIFGDVLGVGLGDVLGAGLGSRLG